MMMNSELNSKEYFWMNILNLYLIKLSTLLFYHIDNNTKWNFIYYKKSLYEACRVITCKFFGNYVTSTGKAEDKKSTILRK